MSPENLQTACPTVRVVDGADRLVVENLRTADDSLPAFCRVTVEHEVEREVLFFASSAPALPPAFHTGRAWVGWQGVPETGRSLAEISAKEPMFNQPASCAIGQQVQHSVGGSSPEPCRRSGRRGWSASLMIWRAVTPLRLTRSMMQPLRKW